MDYSYFDVIRSRMASETNNNTPVIRSRMASDTNSNTAVNGRFPAQTPLAMAYVPFQSWSEPYDAAEGFNAGTLFPELNLPLSCEGGAER